MKPNDFHEIITQCKLNPYFSIDNTDLIAGSCGFICFPLAIGVIQNFVWKKLNVAAHFKLASFYGFTTVFVSSIVSHSVVESVKAWQKKVPLSFSDDKKIVLCSFISLIQFLFVARKFKVVLPSNLLHPGAYAKKGIKLEFQQFLKPATQSHRNKIQIFGYKYGCHTCGKKYFKLVNSIKQFFIPSCIKVEYIADHQPPKAIFSEKLRKSKGYLYPHCFSCSSLQAHQVRFVKQKSVYSANSIITHGMRFKLWKFFIPWSLFFDSDSLFDMAIQSFF